MTDKKVLKNINSVGKSSRNFPGLAPAVEVTGVQSGSEQTFKIPQYKGRYLVLVFFSSSDLVQSFTTIQPLLTSNGTDLVFCSIDSCETLKSRQGDL